MDPMQQSKDVALIAPDGITAGDTDFGYVDTLGAVSGKFLAQIALGATGTIASADGTRVRLLECENTHQSNFATFANAGGTAASFSTLKRSLLVRFNLPSLVDRMRYIAVEVTPGTSGVSNEAVTASAVAAIILENSPTATNDGVGSTNDKYFIG